MIFYVSDFYKKFVTRNNGVSNKLPKIFNHTVDTLEISIVDSHTNQILSIPSGQYYMVGSFVKRDKSTPIFLSTDAEVDGNVLRFNYSTNTYEFLNLIVGENVQIALEIGYIDDDGEHVILQDNAIASQRYYVEGMPDPSHVSDYYTKTQTDAAIIAKINAHNEDPNAHLEILSSYATTEYVDEAIAQIELSGYVTDEEFEEGMATKQNVIDAENKLAYSLLSGTPTIPTQLSQLTNDAGFVTSNDVATALEPYALSSDVQTALSSKADKSQLNDYQEKITNEHRLSFNLLSSVPLIPTRTSELENDANFQTGNDVQAAISGKADKSALNDYQKKITSESKLDYALLSSTPSIPTKTSDLTNDSGFATSAYVQSEVSGKADKSELSSKQDLITNEAKLDYSLLSGVPATQDAAWGSITGTLSSQTDLQDALEAKANANDIPLSTSQLINDSNFSNGVFQSVIEQNGNGTVFVADYAANASIIKYVGDAASGVVSLSAVGEASIPSDNAATVELQIPISADVTTITIPNTFQIIDVPDTLEAESDVITYHEFVFRAERDSNTGAMKQYVNYAYKFTEDLPPTLRMNPQTFNFTSNNMDSVAISYEADDPEEEVTFSIESGMLPQNFDFQGVDIYFDGMATESGTYQIVVQATSESCPQGVSAIMTFNVAMAQPTMPASQTFNFDTPGDSQQLDPVDTGSDMPSYSVISGEFPSYITLDSMTGDLIFEDPSESVNSSTTVVVQCAGEYGTFIPCSGFVTVNVDYTYEEQEP